MSKCCSQPPTFLFGRGACASCLIQRPAKPSGAGRAAVRLQRRMTGRNPSARTSQGRNLLPCAEMHISGLAKMNELEGRCCCCCCGVCVCVPVTRSNGRVAAPLNIVVYFSTDTGAVMPPRVKRYVHTGDLRRPQNVPGTSDDVHPSFWKHVRPADGSSAIDRPFTIGMRHQAQKQGRTTKQYMYVLLLAACTIHVR